MGVQKNRTLLNLGLVLLLSVLAGVTWWQSQQVSGDDVLLAIDRSQIQRVTIERELSAEQPDVLQFEKQKGKWQMVKPQSGEADETRIAHLMTLLSERVESRYNSSDKNLASFELEPGNVRVLFDDHALLLGMANPVSQQRYVLHGDEIKLVSETVFGALQGDVQTFLITPSSPPVSTGQ